MGCPEKGSHRSRDRFLLQLVDAGHTAIFQWIAVWLGSGIGLIQIIIEVLNMPKPLNLATVIFGVIYLFLILLMTFSVYNILNVMHLQNKWINDLSSVEDEVKKLFYDSRSCLSKFMVNERCEMSLPDYVIVTGHFVLLFCFGINVLFISCISAIWPDIFLNIVKRFLMRLFRL